MRIRYFALILSAGAVLAVTVPVIPWKTGDPGRPLPVKVDPGPRPGAPPSDAITLFDGKDLSRWRQAKGGAAQWKLGDGYFEVTPKSGDLATQQAFGDSQIHLEWAAPNPSRGSDQTPGNSGVYLHSLYEIQVLESFHNKTYADGQAGAIYCQYPPLVNASRPPGEWQTYDIIFHGARFDSAGTLTRLAAVTLLHNGVVVQDHTELTGPTDYMKRPPYRPTPEKMPLLLQDHGQPVRYRNIWIRELPPAGK